MSGVSPEGQLKRGTQGDESLRLCHNEYESHANVGELHASAPRAHSYCGIFFLALVVLVALMAHP